MRSNLTEEHEHAHVELQQSGDAERPSLCAAQRIKQQLSAQRALPLLGPHINLLLAVSERTVLPILALLTFLHLCGTQGEKLIFPSSTYIQVFYWTYLHTFTEYKCPQEVVTGRPGPDPLPCGIVCVFEAAQQHIPLAAVCCLWLILVVHHSWT